MTTRRVFYGWIIVAISVVIMTLSLGSGRYSFPIFYVAILDEFDWSRSSTALIYSITMLVYGLAAIVAGILVDKFGLRKILLLGITMLSLGLIACSQITALWHFYLLFATLIPWGLAMSSYPVIAPLVSNWFVEKRGMALGIAMSGFGLAYLIGMLAEYLISVQGWQIAYAILGGMTLLVVSFTLPFLRYRPEDMQLMPDGTTPVETGRTQKPKRSSKVIDEEWVATEWTLSRAMKSYRLWAMCLSSLLIMVCVFVVMTHQIAFAVDMGYNRLFAASIYGLYGVFSTIGHLTGFISDRWGRERTSTVGALIGLVALSMLFLIKDATHPWMLYFFSIGFGFGAGIISPLLTAALADLFQGKAFGSINGIFTTFFGIGGAIGPWLGGYIFDTLGSYKLAFAIAIAMWCLTCVFIWVAAPRKVRLLGQRV